MNILTGLHTTDQNAEVPETQYNIIATLFHMHDA